MRLRWWDVPGATPLILAAAGGHRAFMSLLLSKNANVELATVDKKRTALHEACYHGHPHVRSPPPSPPLNSRLHHDDVRSLTPTLMHLH
jgi:ankyrin repeat protein